jgi:hypothetical protein
MITLPHEIKEAIVYSMKNWPKQLDSKGLLLELEALATRVYILATIKDDKITGKKE